MTTKAKAFVVALDSCSYGKKGDVVKLGTDTLTERQSAMLKPYTEPTVKDLTVAKK